MALDGHFKSFGNFLRIEYACMHAKLDLLVIRFAARYLSVLEIVYNAIIQDATITKRHIYYQDVELFGSQRAVDEV